MEPTIRDIIDYLRKQFTKLFARMDRSTERIEALHAKVDRIEAKMDRILEFIEEIDAPEPFLLELTEAPGNELPNEHDAIFVNDKPALIEYNFTDDAPDHISATVRIVEEGTSESS